MSVFSKHMQEARKFKYDNDGKPEAKAHTSEADDFTPETEADGDPVRSEPMVDPLGGEPVGDPEGTGEPDTMPVMEEPSEPKEDDEPKTDEEPKTEDEPEVTEDVVVEEPEDDEDDEEEVEDGEDTEDAILDDVDEDSDDIEVLEEQMYQIAQARIAVESFGISPGMMKIMQATNLLAGTSLEAIAVESFNSTPGDMTAETQMALEALDEKGEEAKAKWSAKILKIVKGGAERIGNLLKTLWDKVSGILSKITEATWDATKVAGATIKAHPVATVISVIGAMAAVAGVIAFTGGSMPALSAKLPQIESFKTRLMELIRKIPSPFGKIKVSDVSGKLKVVFESSKNSVKAVASAASAKSLGWTKSAASAVSGQLGRAMKTSMDGVNAFAKRGTEISAKVGKEIISQSAGQIRGVHNYVSNATGDRSAGAVASGIFAFALIRGYAVCIYLLITKIIFGGLRLISKTLKAVLGLTEHSEASPA